jgi:uncharacterized protein YcnI
VGATVVAASLVGWAGVASAHVEIDNSSQPAGSTAVLHFLVPDESDTASTVKLEIAIPTDVVIPFVKPEASTAWKISVQTRKLASAVQTDDGTVTDAVSLITYEGGTIAPGQFAQFDIQMGPLPGTPGASIAFPAVQTYSDGTVVRWIDKVVAGQPEPEHPTPLLSLTAPSSSSTAVDHDSPVLAVVALILGGLGVVMAGATLVMVRRRP